MTTDNTELRDSVKATAESVKAAADSVRATADMAVAAATAVLADLQVRAREAAVAGLDAYDKFVTELLAAEERVAATTGNEQVVAAVRSQIEWVSERNREAVSQARALLAA